MKRKTEKFRRRYRSRIEQKQEKDPKWTSKGKIHDGQIE